MFPNISRFIFILTLVFLELRPSDSLQNYIVVLSENTFPKQQNEPGGSSDKSSSEPTYLIAKHDQILESLNSANGASSKASSNNNKKTSNKVYSYYNAINAFSALMTKEQSKIIASRKDVAMVLKDGKLKKNTGHSYKFLGLNKPQVGTWTKTNGSNIIIAMIDDGIWPESASFNDKGYSPKPKKFKGICQTGQNFTTKNCNKKIIGARYLYEGFLNSRNKTRLDLEFLDYASARSAFGHGVHTASIAAGSAVTRATVNDINFGTVMGVAPAARLAVYKVCWDYRGECYISDIIAAIDLAVADGVDIISMSLSSSQESISDVMSMTELGAVLAGVPCVLSGGNSGPTFGTVHNLAPWTLTVAASSIDRKLSNSVVLGNGKSYPGVTFSNAGLFSSKSNYTLVSGDLLEFEQSEYCPCGCNFHPDLEENTVMYCPWDGGASFEDIVSMVYEAGAVGLIISSYGSPYQNDEIPDITFSPIPFSLISYKNGLAVQAYIKSAKSPNVKINPLKILYGPRNIEAPIMGSFSSVGPNVASEYFLKPDITAPGVDIIAAWSMSKLSPVPPYDRTSNFNVMSGTSMACPHVSGAVALIKSLHPSWPPSWLYSAIITTGYTKNNRGTSIKDFAKDVANPFNYGGGHINVNSAVDPGLVYGLTSQDYADLQCTPSIALSSRCDGEKREVDINLPSLSAYSLYSPIATRRRLTLVGKPARYKVIVKSPLGTKVIVTPSSLVFVKVGQTLTYNLTIKPLKPYYYVDPSYVADAFTFGSVLWYDSSHKVNMVIAANVP